MRRTLGIIGAVAGLVGMWAIGAVAPPQPEYMHRGGACNIAPCTTLEDPEAWVSWWRPFVVFLLVYAASLFLLLWHRARTHRGRSSSIAPALALGVAAMVGTFLLEVFGALTSFHMGVAMAITSSVLLGLAAASLIRANSGPLSSVVALVQAFSYAIPRVLNEFFVLSATPPFCGCTWWPWPYSSAVPRSRRRCSLTRSQGGGVPSAPWVDGGHPERLEVLGVARHHDHPHRLGDRRSERIIEGSVLRHAKRGEDSGGLEVEREDPLMECGSSRSSNQRRKTVPCPGSVRSLATTSRSNPATVMDVTNRADTGMPAAQDATAGLRVG